MKKGWIILSVLAVLINFFYVPGVFAGVPQTLNYQGYLNDAVGQPISGTREITFSLYTASTGGEPFWAEVQTVTATDGRFSVILGSNPTNVLNPSSFTGETYIGIKVGADQEMAPRQKFTSVAYALQAGSGGIPSGGIIMWSGSVANIPTGWALCDGTNGTPDLRSKFIIGAGSTYSLGGTGGSTTKNLTHTHTTGDHTLTIDEMPSHTHIQNQHRHSMTNYNDTNSMSSVRGGSSSTSGTANTDYTTPTNQNTGGSQAHNHGSTGTSGNASQDIMPPYYALAFIMKL